MIMVILIIIVIDLILIIDGTEIIIVQCQKFSQGGVHCPQAPSPSPARIFHQCDDHQFDNLINQFNNHLMESCGTQLGVDLFLIVVN